MNKILLSLGTLATFGLYVLLVRGHQASVLSAATFSRVPTAVDNSPAELASSTAPAAIEQVAPSIIPSVTATTGFKDGQYTGTSFDAFYGNVQVKVTVKSGKISDVQFLDYPRERGESVQINSYATPLLRQEAMTAQSAQVDIVSGATQTSLGFRKSLQSALSQAS